MAADVAIALHGFLDEETAPGDLHGSTARLRLTASPTDQVILPCTVAGSELANAVIHDLGPGDKLRVTGRPHAGPADMAGRHRAPPCWRPRRSCPSRPPSAMAVIERYRSYVCYFDADTTGVEVFTEGGTWVGTAPEPNDLGALLEAFEYRQAASGE